MFLAGKSALWAQGRTSRVRCLPTKALFGACQRKRYLYAIYNIAATTYSKFLLGKRRCNNWQWQKRFIHIYKIHSKCEDNVGGADEKNSSFWPVMGHLEMPSNLVKITFTVGGHLATGSIGPPRNRHTHHRGRKRPLVCRPWWPWSLPETQFGHTYNIL